MLAIEIDGGVHDHQTEYDLKRQSELEKAGVSFLRFSDDVVLEDVDLVVGEIEDRIKHEMKNGLVGRLRA
jgi:very-short-patch-repair endonuclease